MFVLVKWSANASCAPCDASGQPLAFPNVGTGIDQSIRQLAEQIAEVVGYEGRIVWDTSKPNGTPKKQLEVSRLQMMGWRASIPLKQGLSLAYQDFQNCLAGKRLRS